MGGQKEGGDCWGDRKHIKEERAGKWREDEEERSSLTS